MGLLSMKMIVNGILGCVSCLKKDVELEKYLVENLYDYDYNLTSLTIVWVGHRGVEFEARKVKLEAYHGKESKGQQGVLTLLSMEWVRVEGL